MNQLAILLPTYGRPKRLAQLVENIHKTTHTPHTIYFVCESSDVPTLDEVRRLNEPCLTVSTGNYVAAINTGYRSTKEPFVFCASDDVEFTDGWAEQMLPYFEDEHIGIVGARDDWVISKTEKHASHFMVRRTYIQTRSGVMDEPNVIYSSSYIHSMCDIETEQTAMGRGAFVISPAIVHHKHWFMNTAPMDSTYQRAKDALEHDMRSYNARRKKFELFKFEDLFSGRVVPIKKGALTVVIPSYNEVKFLKQTVESLKEQTYNEYELIIIDDNSDAETRAYINTLPCVKVFNTEQAYVNANWNRGIALATTEYVCIANNDITFSKHWDLYLMHELEDPDVWIANPFQTDPAYSTAYGKHPRAGDIDIRGACYMLKKEMFLTTGPIPRDFIIWFGDWWLVKMCEKHGKKTVFTPRSVIHHFGSKSSIGMMQDRKRLFFQILRGDAYAFQLKTGMNVDHWLKIIYENLELPSPV